MSKKIGYGVLGLGIGRYHAKAAFDMEEAELVAVCDARPDRLEKHKREYPEMYPDLTVYTKYEDMLANPDIDIISVATPSGTHAEYVCQALRAGKHVLVEKPIDITVDAALKIEEARVRTGKIAGVIHQNRNNCVMKPIKEALDAGRLGKLVLATFAVKWYRDQHYYEGWHGTWEMDGGGSLMNQAIHTVDLMTWLMGEVESVTSTAGIYNHKIDTEDLTASLVKFKSGATATFVSTTCAYPGISTEMMLYGTEGSIEADADMIKTWKMKEPLDDMDEDEEEQMMIDRYGKGNRFAAEHEPDALYGHRHVVEDMICAVRDGRDPEIMPTSAANAVRFVNAVYESAKSGKTVIFE